MDEHFAVFINIETVEGCFAHEFGMQVPFCGEKMRRVVFQQKKKIEKSQGKKQKKKKYHINLTSVPTYGLHSCVD